MRDISRRCALLFLSVLPAWGPFKASGQDRSPVEHELVSTTMSALREAFSDPVAAWNLGRAYLALHPAESDLSILMSRLLDTHNWPAGATLHAQLQKRGKRDFVEGDVVLLDQWVFGRTEARLCALFHLQTGRNDVA
ncbi:MAG: hypothetical protein QF893_01840 [Alphaproteobacteria bacterium]|jgi:hypothetical protein|nr:hypothetical protein [Alphaproteobacteria bacterium]